MKKALLALAAVLLAGIISLFGFVLFGAALPIWIMMAISGTQAVQDSPGHGGIILFLTVPTAGLTSIVAWLFLAHTFYGRFLALSKKPE